MRLVALLLSNALLMVPALARVDQIGPDGRVIEVPLPKLDLLDGRRMPAPAFGTWNMDDKAAEEAVFLAIETGYRHIDTATLYKTERGVGRAIRRAIDLGICTREELFVTTKLWPSLSQLGSRDAVAAALRASLERLQLDYVDLWLLHWPQRLDDSEQGGGASLGYSPAWALETWRWMNEAVAAVTKERGSSKPAALGLGVSNFTKKKLQRLLEDIEADGDPKLGRPLVDQVESHPFLPLMSLHDFCDRKHIRIMAYAPLGSPSRPKRHRRDDDPVLMRHESVLEVAGHYGASPAQALLSWSVGNGYCPIPKSVTPSRILDNFMGATQLVLSTRDMQLLNHLPCHRFIIGKPFAKPGESWQSVWDDENCPEQAE